MCGGGSAPKTQPAVEPMKNVEASMSQAEDSTRREQALRRGLMGMYTRYGGNKQGSAASAAAPGAQAEALAGKAGKVGG